ncbi:MAG TPA: DUF445 family protein [Longimicrobiales bacterium]|nr:DUF445 family protein [Longimicrobiales bacterium]
MSERLLQVLVTVAFGAMAGGVTNAIAVWMLFHPYRPPRLFGRELRFLQGAIPKNQGRLAKAMGRTVGTKLLTPEDLTRTLSEPGFRAAFDERLASFLRSVFNERRGALVELLPPAVTTELRQVLDEAAQRGLLRLDEYLESDDFQQAVTGWVEVLAAELRDRPLSELITPEREAAWTGAAERWLADVAGSESFQRAVADYVDRLAVRLLQPERTFQQLLPLGLVAGVERAIAGYLPIALERLGGLLDDPGARERVERVLHELLDRFMRDLKFHQRLVASLLITPDTIDRVIRAIEAEGAAKISELLQDAAVRDAMARGVNSAIVEFLERPVVSVLGTADEPSVQGAKATATDWILSLAQDPATRGFLVEKLRAMLEKAEERTWGEIFDRLPPDRVARAVVSAARSERAAALYRDLAGRAVEWLLHRPIGRLADHISEEAPARVERALGPALWQWLQDQAPAVAQRIDIVTRVEKKILEFPTAQVEALIRGVTERELQLIVRLGYVLGAGIGLLSAGVSWFFNR